MPRRAPYLLQWSVARQIYEFSDKGFSVPDAVIPDGNGWKGWLSSISSFAFSSRSGVHYTVRKESIQQHGTYWYGYRSLARRTYKRYLGRTEHLSLARLEEIAEHFQETLSLQVVEASQPEALRLLPGLISRLCPPRLPLALVERPALLSRLDNWRSYKLSLLRAPAGVGKTTLVNSWLERHPSSHIAWVSLESSDNTPTSFWPSVISACQIWQEEIGRAALVQLRAASSPPFVAPPLETVLTHFLNDLTTRVSDGILVLDDYQTILEPRIHEAMAWFLEHLPSQLHVLILTRSEPPLPLTRWRAMGWVQEFSSTDLRFSGQETATFLQYTTGSTFSAETIIQLADLLQGWIAGLRLLVLAGQMTERGVERQLAKLDKQIYPDEFQRQLVDYFLTEVLSIQPESLQFFLLQTCSLPRLTADLCDTVTDRQDSAALLDAIERAGLFLEARDEGEPWYCYSSLFAEAMRDEASRRLGEQALCNIASHASLWYEQHALAIESIETALLAHDTERAGLLIEHFGTQGQRYDLHMLRRWLEQIPESLLNTHPALCLYLAIALQFGGEPARLQATRLSSDELLQRAEDTWRRSGKLQWIGSIYALRALQASLQMRPAYNAVEYANEALALFAEHDAEGQPEAQTGTLEWRMICLGIVGLADIHRGQFEKARQHLLEALAYGRSGDDQPFLDQIALKLGEICFAEGELHQAREYYQRALDSAQGLDHFEEAIQALSGLAQISLEMNEPGLAERWVNTAQEHAQRRNRAEHTEVIYLFALLHFVRRQYVTAELRLATLLARLQVSSAQDVQERLLDVLALQTRLQLARGDLSAAQRSMAMVTKQTGELAFVQQITIKTLQARLLLAQGQINAAILLLEQLLPQIYEKQYIRGQLESQLLLALAHITIKQKDRAQCYLQQALSLAQRTGYLCAFLVEGEMLIRLLRSSLPVLREKAARSYGRRILRAYTLSEGSLVSPVSGQRRSFERLSAQEQRVLRLLVAGHTNLEIANELVISLNTVKDHIKHLYRKLGVGSRLEASEVARDLRLS